MKKLTLDLFTFLLLATIMFILAFSAITPAQSKKQRFQEVQRQRITGLSSWVVYRDTETGQEIVCRGEACWLTGRVINQK